MDMTSFRLFFGGTETPVWRKLLKEEGVQNVALSFLHLRPRLPIHKQWLVSANYEPEQNVFLDSGAFGVNKKKDWKVNDYSSYFDAYLDFVQANMDRIEFFTECDFTAKGQEWVEKQRYEIWESMPQKKFIPIWHEEWGSKALAAMIERYENVGVSPMSDSMENRVAALVRRSTARLHGLGFAHPTVPSGALYSTITSTSWISPMQHGETIIWDHNRLRRYPNDQKDIARRRHRSQFIQAGFDADAILADESGNRELARYTVWAWRQMEAQMQGPPEKVRRIRVKRKESNSNGHVPSLPTVDYEPSPVALLNGNTPHNEDLLPVPIAGLKVLPTMGFVTKTSSVPATEDHPAGEISVQVQTSVVTSMRKCESCSLQALCPEYDVDRNTCAYMMPVQIKTREQLMGTLTAMLETQQQRIGFARMSEELQGGYPDQNLSAEMDRFMAMVIKVKDIEDNRDMFKVSIEGRGDAGVLSRIFGEKATAPLRAVDPDKSEQAVKKMMQG